MKFTTRSKVVKVLQYNNGKVQTKIMEINERFQEKLRTNKRHLIMDMQIMLHAEVAGSNNTESNAGDKRQK